MRKGVIAFGLAIIVLPSELSAQSIQPRGLPLAIDELFLLQDKSAQGSLAASAAQKALLLEISTTLAKVPDTQFASLAPLTIAYVLSGGDPDLAERISSGKDVSPRDRDLLRASAEFMRGDREAATDVFARVNALSLPGRLAGRVALAQALLLQDEARQRHFAVAISAMPGTLIEESALRRSALGYAEVHDERGFWSRLERYARRFPSSAYSMEFWSDIMLSVVRWRSKEGRPSFEKLDLILVELPQAQRRSVYLALAEEAAASGQSELAGFASQRVRRLSIEGSTEDLRGQFFMALFGIVSADGDSALLTLRSFPHNILDSREQALLAAALSLGLQIERPVQSSQEFGDNAPEKTELEARGADLLSKSNLLITDPN